ncbi:Uu.00g060280.m01.CDS01 [Anthostomella pinea]|uniref:Uu.00g060280.m01.CDS01 n=1 Tax=Anthostomella pinea TaxID=933095 RepID=A0AAI8YMB3_9PEZI|nr:Uu.00g060280.m01.CDS01 [Anthostomella pinea]
MNEQIRQSGSLIYRASFVDCTIVILTIAFLSLIRTRYYHRLNRVPGPFLASLTSLWKWNAVRREKMAFINAELHEKYGPLVRIGPNHISASSAESIRVIHRSKNGFTKSAMYGILQPKFEGVDLHNIFST